MEVFNSTSQYINMNMSNDSSAYIDESQNVATEIGIGLIIVAVLLCMTCCLIRGCRPFLVIPEMYDSNIV